MSIASATRRRTVAAVQDAMRAILYLRLSDLRDDDLDAEGTGKTFNDREQDLRDFVEDMGGIVAEVVIENDVARKNGKQRNASAFKRRRVRLADGTMAMRVVRPGFDSVLEMLSTGKANCLVTEDSDRITRDQFDGGRLIEIVEARKLNVRTLTGAFNLTNGGTDTEIGAAWDAINKANQESRKIANRVRRGRKRKVRRGEFGGGPRPYGFEADGISKRWDECLVIETASYRVLRVDGRPGREGKLTSLRSLAAELRAAEVPTASGKPWSAEALRDILLRARNAGILVYQGEEVGPAPWKPLVPEHIYRAVVRVLTDPKRRTNEGRGREPRWWGSGIFRCGVCDDGTTCWVSGGKDRAPRYTCKAHSHLTRNAAHVDGYVRDVLVERLSRPDAAALFAAPTGPDVDVDALRTELAAIRQNMNELAADRGAGLIDREQLIAGTVSGRERAEKINEILAGQATGANATLVPLLAAEDIGAAFDALPLLTRREVLNAVVTVTIMPTANRGGRGFDPASVLVAPKRGLAPVPGRQAAEDDQGAATAA